ncbi:hypothetical protein VIOR3934_19680 [Vibrio orientalis CIP 102891 = ATCC 33934]|uniref:Uncharacterized protein n=1 Tax=Vibrio orientalis CIP 102891 = ATCC 33934 TaxID=675816 RepID=C9QEA0_VIBOR|nr:hypothetical protein [Vibrio orientalis]EEX94373.1 hypothetical protein VIA_001531 [Vibrio orientalis CIP 102891 = ATCC 33934]EGU54081.1 hypothetical protein VIOR3934_19680 [Vibrio orientalis CIP 102891 = ATCC 33934]
MKTKLINSDNKLANDDQISDWLKSNESEIDSVEYHAAILGINGRTEYRTVTVGGLDQLVKLTNALANFGLVDLLKDSGPVKGFDSVFDVKEKA